MLINLSANTRYSIRLHESTSSGYRRTSSGTEGQIEGDYKANNYFLQLFSNASRQKEQ
jgi:hypothetical protein